MQKKSSICLMAAAVLTFSAGFVWETEQSSAQEIAGVAVATDVPVATGVPVATDVPVATGTTETSGWHTRQEGTLYYIDAAGKKVTGIVEIDGLPYYFSADGTLRTGWQTVEGNRYYYDPDTGALLLGWLEFQGERYYISREKGKLTGWADVSSEEKTIHCYFDENGTLQTGFFRTEQKGMLYYAEDSGNVLRGGVYLIDDVPYWFYDSGELHTGWQTVDGIRRYYDPRTGKVQKGWIIWNDQYYYATAENGKFTGLQQVDGEYYPFSQETGAVTEGFCQLPDGMTRYYYENGSYHTGWLKQKKEAYYFGSQGEMFTGWQTIAKSIYYFGQDGVMASGFWEIDGDTYYFDTEGRQQFGLLKIGSSLYYLDSDTGVIHRGWITLDGNTYYFQEDGKAKTGFFEKSGNTYYFGRDGVMVTGWQTIGGKRYCFREDGTMVVGWQTDSSGRRYYFGTDGVMVTGWQEIGGYTYYFGSNGSCAAGVTAVNDIKYYFDPATGILLRNGTWNGVTTNSAGVVTRVLLNTPYLSQKGFPTGCESASATMLLQAAGYHVSIGAFIDNALDIGSLYYDNGHLYGPDPSSAFIGDPRSSHGYGCYAPVITRGLNRLLGTQHQAKNLTGTAISKLLTDYIDQGTPVAVWATINMMEPAYGTQWIVPETGGLFTWISHEHCLVLVGYDDAYYYMNDPYKDNGLVAYERSIVEARYAALGYQAVAIVNR